MEEFSKLFVTINDHENWDLDHCGRRTVIGFSNSLSSHKSVNSAPCL
jgi:hypothetical protein